MPRSNTPAVSPDIIRSNKVKSILAYAFRALALLFASGTLLQTLLASLGFETRYIYFLSTLMQAANMAVIMFFSRWADTGSVIRRAANTFLAFAALMACYIPLCIWRSASLESYLLLLVLCIVQQGVSGLYVVCEYKLPYHVYLPEEYGRISAASGLLSSLITLGAGAGISALVLRFDYVSVMAVGFAVSALLMLASFFLTYTQRSLINEAEPVQHRGKDAPKIPIMEIFKTPVFSFLLIPNLFRGFSSGVISVLTTVAFDLGYDEWIGTAMVSVNSLSALLSCALFGVLAAKISSRAILAAGSVLISMMPLLLIPSETVFLAVYAVVIFGVTLVNYVVPVFLLTRVDVKIAGPYHAWRMVLNFGGMLTATFLAPFFSVPLLLALAAASQILSCLGYCLFRGRGDT